MAERAGCDGGSSRHHRDRQLRAWHRHVKVTVAMELAAFHHSAQPAGLVVGGPREEVHETNTALRRQNDPLSGRARRLLWRWLGRRKWQSRSVTWLVPVLLSSSCRHCVTGTPSTTPRSTSSLMALKTPEQVERLRTAERRLAREKEEEEQEKKKREQDEPTKACREIFSIKVSGSASSPSGATKRKRKKRRKKKLPKASPSLPARSRGSARSSTSPSQGFSLSSCPLSRIWTLFRSLCLLSRCCLRSAGSSDSSVS